MMQHHVDELCIGFQEDARAFLKKYDKQKSKNDGRQKDPELMKCFSKIADSMARTLSTRFVEYAEAYDLDRVAFEPEVGRKVPRVSMGAASMATCARVQQLEAEMQQRSDEEDRLRSEVMARMQADSDAALLHCNVESLQARQATVAPDDDVDVGPVATKGDRLRQELRLTQAILSATSALTAEVDKERENNRRIENQLSRPLNSIEADLLAPVGHGTQSGLAPGVELDEESQRFAVELEQSQGVCKHMQRHFEDDLM